MSLHLDTCSLEAGTTNCSEKCWADNAPGKHSPSDSIARQNDNIARQEAEQARCREICCSQNCSITVEYADAGELAKAGEKLLSAKGSITVQNHQSPFRDEITKRR
ncbi:hypothetical protein ACLK19_22635 [Escherichia coli]